MQEKSIRAKNVNKFFGKTQVLNSVSITCRQGEITGITGRNGAGKTVLFKIFLGLLSLDSGEIYINGKRRIKQAGILSFAGTIIEEPAFLKNYSGRKNLEFLYMISGGNTYKSGA